MNKFIRFYNQNRLRFWLIVVTIVIIVSIPRALNNYIKKQKEKEGNNRNNVTESYNRINKNPSISGKSVSEETTKKSVNIIDTFMENCNNQNIEEAYSLLSSDCKEQLFPELQDFENYYFKIIFYEKRTYDIETFFSTDSSVTYRISMMGDILSSGKSNGLETEDYYTVVEEGGQSKLNIKGYIGKAEINKENTYENITFNVVEKYMYMDYEIFKIKVKNNTGNSIMVDGKDKTRTVNVEDKNEVKYYALLNEVGDLYLTVLPGITKEIEIKFNKTYSTKNKERYINFNNVILDIENPENNAKIKVEI